MDNQKRKMNKDIYTINKSLLLNWLYFCEKDLPIEELGQWIKAKTDGKYILIENSNVKSLSPLDEIKHK